VPGSQVHRQLTEEWAIDEGMAPADARLVAAADRGVDARWPGSRSPARHFNPTATLVFAPAYLRSALRILRAADGADLAAHATALERLGWALHCRQDGIAHGVFGELHLLHSHGVLGRNPDDWGAMPQRTRDAIERATRRMVRRFLAAEASAGSGYNL
jgi:hypothetical protein